LIRTDGGDNDSQHEPLKKITVFVFNVILVLGALACVFQWLSLRPGDVKRMTIPHPHWLWLVGAFLLFGMSLRDSIRGLLRRGSVVANPLSSPQSKISNEAKKRAFTGLPSSDSPKILCRIIDAVAGPSRYAPTADVTQILKALMAPEVEIIFRLRLMNQEAPPTTFAPTAWTIELTDGEGKHLAAGYGQPVGEMFFPKHTSYGFEQKKKERFDRDIITELSKIPMDVNVPIEGWSRFTVSGLSLFHAFGATIKMTAVTDTGRKWCGFLQSPGKWLSPAEFSLRPDVSSDKQSRP
jgi:hypothetical protein